MEYVIGYLFMALLTFMGCLIYTKYYDEAVVKEAELIMIGVLCLLWPIFLVMVGIMFISKHLTKWVNKEKV